MPESDICMHVRIFRIRILGVLSFTR